MDYISVRQAADKWGVSMRQVQLYIKDKRVGGAVRPGHDWLIPANAAKPISMRNLSARKSLFSDLAEIFAATIHSIPFDNPYAVLDTVTDERLRLNYESELAYLRGDFAQVKECYQKTASNDALRLRVCSLAIAAAISMGDYTFYQDIEDFLKNTIKEYADTTITMIAELCLASAYVNTFAAAMVPAWLKTGDFSAFSIQQLKLDAVFKRVKYFQAIKQYESMLAAAETAVAFCDAKCGLAMRDVYFRVVRAIACCGLNRTNEAKIYLSDAMNIYLPHGFITPFAESAQAFCGLLEQILERDFPKYYDAVTRQWTQIAPNWIKFHNRFTKDNIAHMLSLRDYQLASLVARRIPYKEISRQFNISTGRLNNIMREIYAELFVSNRDELAKLIL
jgi:DNA-binding CsgD family transcriptional regulator